MEKAFLSLSELLAMLEETVNSLFPSSIWVTAEIADLRCDQSGHWYLELVEKHDGELKARIRGTIWASFYPSIITPFVTLTGQTLARGMEILALVRVRLHPVYGLSLDIRSIDPQYSLGAMMRHKREVLERLAREGLLEANRNLPFPLVPQRIAVLSSPHAAGFEDFVTHLAENPYGFSFLVELFPTFVQGEEVEESVLLALAQVQERCNDFDVLVILRGGGAQSDLHWFDSYPLGRAVATFPLPVLVGIGHQRDATVLDAVAYFSFRTPTAVADFLIERMREFDILLLETSRRLYSLLGNTLRKEEEALAVLLEALKRSTQKRLRNALEEIGELSWELRGSVRRVLEVTQRTLEDTWKTLQETLKKTLEGHHTTLEHALQALTLLDPHNVLRRGYTLTTKNGKIVQSARECQEGDRIETWFADGRAMSEVVHSHVFP